jgi:uncharacterized membrane protein YhhN
VLKSLKKFTATDILAFLFVAFEIAVFPLIQFTPGDVSAVWSYIAIVLVGVMALLTFRRGALDNLIRVGILFTLIADYFLVLDGEKQLHGVLAFICVQAMYFSYLFTKEKRASVRKINLLSRIFVSLALVFATFIVLGKDTDALAIASVLYYSNLVLNAVFAFALGREERIFAIGLVLFAMCDLCIGLEVLFNSYLNSDALGFFYGANINLPWIFYQPSQVLIALNLHFNRKKRAKI